MNINFGLSHKKRNLRYIISVYQLSLFLFCRYLSHSNQQLKIKNYFKEKKKKANILLFGSPRCHSVTCFFLYSSHCRCIVITASCVQFVIHRYIQRREKMEFMSFNFVLSITEFLAYIKNMTSQGNKNRSRKIFRDIFSFYF